MFKIRESFTQPGLPIKHTTWHTYSDVYGMKVGEIPAPFHFHLNVTYVIHLICPQRLSLFQHYLKSEYGLGFKGNIISAEFIVIVKVLMCEKRYF